MALLQKEAKEKKSNEIFLLTYNSIKENTIEFTVLSCNMYFFSVHGLNRKKLLTATNKRRNYSDLPWRFGFKIQSSAALSHVIR